MPDSKDSVWARMLKRLPQALDPMEARAQRDNHILGSDQAGPAPDPWIESSNSPRMLAAQRAFDEHMAEIARLQAQAPQPAVAPVSAPASAEPFDPSSYTTYKRGP